MTPATGLDRIGATGEFTMWREQPRRVRVVGEWWIASKFAALAAGMNIHPAIITRYKRASCHTFWQQWNLATAT